MPCIATLRRADFGELPITRAARTMQREFQLNINGQQRTVTAEEERSLLEILREDLGLTGTKYGCGEGECGACTILVGDRAERSCLLTMADAEGEPITTIEGLAPATELHPVQQAFIERQAMQCGYCVPGQILTAVALLRANPSPSREEILAAMRGNLCRCCNYPNILSAVEHVAQV
jgi:aerobic-type carbon monoxide dehydrogenase small subunit (CoxS/CutS family)